MLQIPGLKMFNDGGSCNLPARSFEYPFGGYGDLYYRGEELAEYIIEAQDRGYQVAIHGLGDRALEEIMNAYEIALDGGPNTYHHRIEHNTIVRDDMLHRYTELDLVATIFGQYAGCTYVDGNWPSPEEYQHWEVRWRSLLDANPDVHFAWHSDAPPIGKPKPMDNIYSFVTRRDFREDGTICEPAEWVKDDAITVEEALSIMTIEGAYALLRDHEIGSLKAGKLADLIILSDNPLEVSSEELLDIQTLLTMVGGEVVYCAPGKGDVCP
jgi:predicted amidohydrolase YtcJ